MPDDPKPTLDGEAAAEPLGEVKPTIEEPSVDVDAVLKELEAIGKTTPESVRNMHTASQQTGRYANEIGELRQEIERMRTEANVPRQAPPRNEFDAEYGGESVDLGRLVDDRLHKFWGDIQKQQAETYQRQVAEMNDIYTDEDYELVKDVWDQYAKTPNFNVKLNTGNTTLKGEYDKFVRSYFRQVALKSRDALVVATKGGKRTPPHIESGNQAPPSEEESGDKHKNVRKIAAKTQGSDADIDAMIGALLPKDDPILRRD